MRTRLLFLTLLACNTLMAQVTLKVKTSENEYNVEDATHITFSDDLSVQAIHTNADTTLYLPIRSIREVLFGDTAKNVTDYIMSDPDCKIYRWALYEVEMLLSNSPYASFAANFADPAQVTEGSTSVTPELQSRFALFVPTDSALALFPHNLSLVTRRPCVVGLEYTGATYFPIKGSCCRYNQETGEVASQVFEQLNQSDIVYLLHEFLLQHTIFFDRPEDRELGIRSGNEYFKTMAGTVIRVAADGKSVQGAMQMENAQKGIGFSTCGIIDSHRKHNGTIYKIDSPVLPPHAQKTAYSVLSGEGYEEFFKLCQTDYDVIKALFWDDNLSTLNNDRQLEFFCTFVDSKGVDYNLYPFPAHPFTLYAPSNEAVRQAIADGLPTWESLAAAYGDGVSDEAARAEGRKKVYELINFVRYHFHFGTEVADKLPFAARTHATPVILPDSYVTPQLSVSSAGNGTLSVTDATGQVYQVMDEGKNTFVRDVVCSAKPLGTTVTVKGIGVQYESPGVIHRINGVLRYK